MAGSLWLEVSRRSAGCKCADKHGSMLLAADWFTLNHLDPLARRHTGARIDPRRTGESKARHAILGGNDIVVWPFWFGDAIDFIAGPLLAVQGQATSVASAHAVEDGVAITFGQEPVKLARGKDVEVFDLPNPVHIQQPLIETIVTQLLGQGICASTGETALRTTRVMDAALEGYYGGRADAFWERPASWPGRRC